MILISSLCTYGFLHDNKTHHLGPSEAIRSIQRPLSISSVEAFLKKNSIGLRWIQIKKALASAGTPSTCRQSRARARAPPRRRAPWPPSSTRCRPVPSTAGPPAAPRVCRSVCGVRVSASRFVVCAVHLAPTCGERNCFRSALASTDKLHCYATRGCRQCNVHLSAAVPP